MTEWNLDNIELNDEEISKQLKLLFKQWIEEYEPKVIASSQPPVPTKEEAAMIKMLREKGLI